MHQPEDVTQWHAPLAKVFTHLTWFVRIFQATFNNDMKHCTRYARITHGLCALARWHRCQPKLGTITKGLWTSGKWYNPMRTTSSKPTQIDTACAHLERGIGRWNATSTRACIHYSWCVHIDWVTFASSNIRKHQPRHVLFEQVILSKTRKH